MLAVDAEKQHEHFKSDIEHFHKGELKHAEVHEKHVMPDKSGG